MLPFPRAAVACVGAVLALSLAACGSQLDPDTVAQVNGSAVDGGGQAVAAVGCAALKPVDRRLGEEHERDARKASATEATVTGAADALLSYGEPANAEELYTIALGKPGADMPRVLTRLGIAQVDQGKYAAAQETFAKVTGKRQPIARLWSSYAASKVMPTPAPATAAADCTCTSSRTTPSLNR